MSDIVIQHRVGTDRWGRSTHTQALVVRDVPSWPRESVEPDRGPVVTGTYVMLPPGAPRPFADSVVRVGVELDERGEWVEGTGEPFEVDGDPGEWTWLDGTEAGVQVALRRARGG